MYTIANFNKQKMTLINSKVLWFNNIKNTLPTNIGVMTVKRINFTKHYQKNHKKKYTVNVASNCV